VPFFSTASLVIDLVVFGVITLSQPAIAWKLRKIVRDLKQLQKGIPINYTENARIKVNWEEYL